MDQQTFSTDVQTLLKHQLHLNLGFLLLIVLIIGGAGFLFYKENQHFDKQLEQAQQTEQTFLEAQKTWKQEHDEMMQQIVQLSSQQHTVTKVLQVRDNQTEKRITQVQAPSRTAEQTQEDVHQALGFLPGITSDDSFLFTQPQTQQVVASRIDELRLKQDLADTQQLYTLEQSKNRQFQADYSMLQNTMNDCTVALNKYKHLSKPTRWHRILGVAKHIGEGALVGVIGYELGHVI